MWKMVLGDFMGWRKHSVLIRVDYYMGINICQHLFSSVHFIIRNYTSI